MHENEYLVHYLIRERLREAEARGAFHSMLRQSLRGEVSRDSARPTWSGLWWQATVAWVAHLTLPKIWNRL